MAPAPVLPIAALLGKADTAFKMVGGSSIVFNAIRGTIFGKVLRTVEYPDGELRSVKIRRMRMATLAAAVADAQPPPFPTAFVEPRDVRQIAIFTSPHFTEPVTTDAAVSAIPDNAWLLWSKEPYDSEPIPLTGVKLDGSHLTKKPAKPPPSLSDVVLQDRAIAIARRVLRASRLSSKSPPSSLTTATSTHSHLSQLEHDRLVDLAVDRDSSLVSPIRPPAHPHPGTTPPLTPPPTTPLRARSSPSRATLARTTTTSHTTRAASSRAATRPASS